MLLPEAVWNSVVSVANEDGRFARTTRFRTQQPPFCELVWPTDSRRSCCCSLNVSTSQ
uniref:Uncharacterized protein n=1 Tax=Anguilla anguilla TaxID=7936 RepID=A0A0E9PS42_ANGAN